MDWTCIGPDGESRGFVVTTSHSDEILSDVVAFAEAWHLDEPSSAEIIEVEPAAGAGEPQAARG